jgi:hypothetical protein
MKGEGKEREEEKNLVGVRGRRRRRRERRSPSEKKWHSSASVDPGDRGFGR